MAKVSEWAGMNSALKVLEKFPQSRNLVWSEFSGCCSHRKTQAVHFCAQPDFMQDISHTILVCSSGNLDRQSRM